jgi:ACR3 family arsenite efflux pump ArsB
LFLTRRLHFLTIAAPHHLKRPKRLVSRTRLVMGLLLIVAIPIFIGLANKAVRENAETIGAFQRAFVGRIKIWPG